MSWEPWLIMTILMSMNKLYLETKWQNSLFLPWGLFVGTWNHDEEDGTWSSWEQRLCLACFWNTSCWPVLGDYYLVNAEFGFLTISVALTQLFPTSYERGLVSTISQTDEWSWAKLSPFPGRTNYRLPGPEPGSLSLWGQISAGQYMCCKWTVQ